MDLHQKFCGGIKMLEQIKNILLLHEGKRNSITSAEIAHEIGIAEDDTHAKTRSLILECAKKYNLPLAAYNKGYYLIVNQQEYDEYMNNLDLRSAGIQERKSIITKNFKDRKQCNAIKSDE